MKFVVMLAALLLAASGILVLRYAWAQRRRQPAILLVAWGLEVAALAAWTVASTPDWGVAVGLLVLMASGLLVIGYAALNAPKASGRDRAPRAADKPAFSWRRGGRRIAVFLLAGPISAAIALALCLWFYGAASDLAAQTRLATTLFLLPLAWAVLTLVATFDMPFFKRGAYLAALGVPAVLGAYGLI